MRTEDPPGRIHRAADHYRTSYRWPMVIVGGQLLLSLGTGLAGLAVSAARGGQANHELGLYQLTYPVLPAVDPRGRWVFLARTGPEPLPGVPGWVALLQAGHRLPLPPSSTADGGVRWIVPPNRCLAGIPGVAPLLVLFNRMGQP